MRKCVTDYLVQEHQELMQLLNELTDELRALPLARDAAERFEHIQQLCQEISISVQTHQLKEEAIIYPALEEHLGGLGATLERMRLDHDEGEAVQKAFLLGVEALAKGSKDRQYVVQSGRSYIHWVRQHLLDENGRLFPMVERGLDPETQREVRRAMEELSRETTARLASTLPGNGRA
jgi:hemerythrin-like domain-containing protein